MGALSHWLPRDVGLNLQKASYCHGHMVLVRSVTLWGNGKGKGKIGSLLFKAVMVPQHKSWRSAFRSFALRGGRCRMWTTSFLPGYWTCCRVSLFQHSHETTVGVQLHFLPVFQYRTDWNQLLTSAAQNLQRKLELTEKCGARSRLTICLHWEFGQRGSGESGRDWEKGRGTFLNHLIFRVPLDP